MDQGSVHCARILIVDDQLTNVRLLEMILRTAGFTEVHGSTDPEQAGLLFVEYAPDLVLLDLHMPRVDGFMVLEQIKHLITPGDYLPVVILSGDATREAKQRALAGGAKDFLTKPFDATEVLLRIRNLLDTRSLHLRLREHNRLLEDKVLERTRDLEQAQREIIERLALAAEYRDDDTGQHTYRVGHSTALLADALGLGAARAELLRQAAPLHDVGKIGVSDLILHKPGRLTPEEFETMKRHTTMGARIVDGSRSPLLQLAQDIAISHHERWDGGGYPHGAAGEDIPLIGRMVAVADVFDALTNVRPYKQAWPVDRAIDEIERQSGLQFDPQVVAAFTSLVKDQHSAIVPESPEASVAEFATAPVASAAGVPG